MKDTNKKSIDTRTFPEIWESLGKSTPDQLSLRDAIMDRLHVTRQTVNYWGTGKYTPVNDFMKKVAAQVVNRELGIHTTFRTLFPAR